MSHCLVDSTLHGPSKITWVSAKVLSGVPSSSSTLTTLDLVANMSSLVSQINSMFISPKGTNQSAHKQSGCMSPCDLCYGPVHTELKPNPKFQLVRCIFSNSPCFGLGIFNLSVGSRVRSLGMNRILAEDTSPSLPLFTPFFVRTQNIYHQPTYQPTCPFQKCRNEI